PMTGRSASISKISERSRPWWRLPRSAASLTRSSAVIHPRIALQKFRRDDNAVSAVEFAMLLPLILLLLLGGFDMARAIDVKTKTSLLSRTISDFVSQGDSVTTAQLATIVQAARSVMYPYPFDASVLTV